MFYFLETLGIAQDVDEKERTLRAANGSPDLRGPLFVRARTKSDTQGKTHKLISRKSTRPLHIGRESPRSTNGVGPDEVRNGVEDRNHGNPGELHEQMDSMHIGPVKLVGKKVAASKAWIRNVFKGKTARKKKARTAGRPASKVHLHDEAHLGVAKRVSVMPVKAPQPSRPSFFVERAPPDQRPPCPPISEQPRPSLQSARVDASPQLPPPDLQSVTQPSRPQRSPPRLQGRREVDQTGQPRANGCGRSSTRRTTRAMMEGYD